MKVIVIDTSSILAICKEDENGDAEIRAIDGCCLVAPESVRWELVNALTQGVYKKKMTQTVAERAYNKVMAMPIAFVDIDKKAAMEIAISRQIMSYDSFVLQCAIENKLPLLTSEKDAVNKMPYHARALGIKLVEVTL